MKLPNISDVDQWDQPGKSGEARSRGKREKEKKRPRIAQHPGLGFRGKAAKFSVSIVGLIHLGNSHSPHQRTSERFHSAFKQTWESDLLLRLRRCAI